VLSASRFPSVCVFFLSRTPTVPPPPPFPSVQEWARRTRPLRLPRFTTVLLRLVDVSRPGPAPPRVSSAPPPEKKKKVRRGFGFLKVWAPGKKKKPRAPRVNVSSRSRPSVEALRGFSSRKKLTSPSAPRRFFPPRFFCAFCRTQLCPPLPGKTPAPHTYLPEPGGRNSEVVGPLGQPPIGRPRPPSWGGGGEALCGDPPTEV